MSTLSLGCWSSTVRCAHRPHDRAPSTCTWPCTRGCTRPRTCTCTTHLHMRRCPPSSSSSQTRSQTSPPTLALRAAATTPRRPPTPKASGTRCSSRPSVARGARCIASHLRARMHRYAVQQLHERAPHATLYLDAGHGGWLGWPEQADHFATVIKNLPGGVYHHLRGFATNVANYQVGVTEPRAVPSRGPPRPARIHTPVRPFTGPRRAVPSRGLPRPPVTIPRRMVLQCAHGRPRMLRRPVGAARACTPCMCVPWPRGRARRSHVCMPCPRMHAQVRSALAVQLGQQ